MRSVKGKGLLGFFVVAVLGCAAFLSACQSKKEPITLTVWHVYGSQTDSPMNAMVDEFNQTVGKDKGITIQVNQISNTNSNHEAVLAGANKEPGAAQLPDLFVSYPKTVLSMPDSSVLVDFNDYFTKEELAEYIPEFVEEGYVQDKLLVFPIAKSTEILFVDKTLFDRFASETGCSLDMLSTWNGLFDVAVKYYRWSDAQTPDIANDGKNFFVHDYPFNYLQVNVEALGDDFFENEKIKFSDNLRKVWIPYAKAAIQGGVWLQEGYATEPLRTGDAIVSVASSASVLYYEDIVTYSNNISEDIEVISMRVPVFDGAKELVMQRGAGFCITKSTKEREAAAVEFIKWLTKAENNVRFVTEAGYMPVTAKGFELLPEAVLEIESTKYKSLYDTYVKVQNTYDFYTVPQFSGYLDLESKTEKNVRRLLKDAREEYITEISKWNDIDDDDRLAKEDDLANEIAVKYLAKYQDLFN